ncbi:MAG: hypothetical protein COZ28_03210 [Candidatus Moranbacteria bacterium CG_4_10_14_3_um_filter_44_15]|nr:MAG: hypothetical protein COS72_04405 [Candidatus Moranbacteria bacterium CG06_land_8_20_14_3_00_43_56]PIX90524.1 MAG: hypothetical protein COZ28_03210 [Candidatus Moranbacteria bacterium CG_4_10_14_3_um_filter_44_15]PJA85840.1 MAG: hypothetical protein CO142_02580 [Candidatus Moranbacteria bacterium CG_4_9_14_3_um_filter_44_28]
MTEINKPAKKEIPFIEILKEAARIVWRNKFLLWFGVLMALGSPGSFNIGNNENWGEKSDAAKNFLETHWQIVLAVALVLFAIGIILFLISLVGKAGLVRSVNLIVQNKKTTFRAGWREGKKYLWRLFRLFLLFFFATMIIILVLALPVVYLAVTGSWVGAVLVGLLAIAIFIPLIFILALTNIFAEFYIILSDLKVWSAVESGYNLLLKNILNSIVFGLLLMVINLAAMMIFFSVAAIALFILVPAGVLFYYLNKIVFGIFLAIAILLFVLTILLVSSIFLTYKTTAWTLFFREIAKVENEEAEKVAEKETGKQIAATPEKA